MPILVALEIFLMSLQMILSTRVSTCLLFNWADIENILYIRKIKKFPEIKNKDNIVYALCKN